MAMMKAHKGKIRVQSDQTDSAGGGIAKPQLKETTVPPSTLHRAADGGSAAVVGEGGRGEELSVGSAGTLVWHHRGGRCVAGHVSLL